MDEALNEAMEVMAETSAVVEVEAEMVREFATIGEVYEDGVSLIFDGETEPSQKHYLCNRCCYFAPGDRVRILADGGTYIVEYPVGAPLQRDRGIPAGGDADQVLTKNTNGDYDVGWKAVNGVPSGGSNGQVLTKSASGAGWETPSYVPSGGSNGQVLTKNASGAGWADVNAVPSGGSTGQVLTKTASGAGWQTPNYVPSSGTTGYVLTKTADGATFQKAPAEMAAEKVTNLYTTGANRYSNSYVIQFKTGGTSGDNAKKFYIRMGTSGTWYQITTS